MGAKCPLFPALGMPLGLDGKSWWLLPRECGRQGMALVVALEQLQEGPVPSRTPGMSP